MRCILTLRIAMLLFVSTSSMAATVGYQHPDLTIVAEEEPLDSVLKSLGKEMGIYITVPTGLNPVVNCDIQHQPVKQAFKTLLGELSYSLEWEKKTGKLVGLTILASGGESAVATVADDPSHTQSVQQAETVANTYEHGAEMSADQSEPVTPLVRCRTCRPSERNIRHGSPRSERRMTQRRRHEEVTAAYLESQGLQSPQ